MCRNLENTRQALYRAGLAGLSLCPDCNTKASSQVVVWTSSWTQAAPPGQTGCFATPFHGVVSLGCHQTPAGISYPIVSSSPISACQT